MPRRSSSFAGVLCLAAGLLSSSRSLAYDSARDDYRPAHGAVFTISNEAQGNRVLAFARMADGTLASPQAYPTHGLGSGDSLGSQGALTLSGDQHFLLVVNAGSDEISSFAVRGATLTLRDTISSGGD